MPVSNYDDPVQDWIAMDASLRAEPAEEPCRQCRGRGFERNNEDEPCSRCWGECVEPH